MVQSYITPSITLLPLNTAVFFQVLFPITVQKKVCTVVKDFKYHVLSSVYNAYNSKRSSTTDLCILFYQNVFSITD